MVVDVFGKKPSSSPQITFDNNLESKGRVPKEEEKSPYYPYLNVIFVSLGKNKNYPTKIKEQQRLWDRLVPAFSARIAGHLAKNEMYK